MATPLLFSLPDPVGDASGDGSYQLPAAPAMQKSDFDIRSLNVQNVGGKLRLTVSLSAIHNPWQALSGWSGVTLDIFIKTAAGGRTALDDLALSTPGLLGWQEHYRLNGFGVQHFQATNLQATNLQATSGSTDSTSSTSTDNASTDSAALVTDQNKVTVRGTDIVLDTALPAGNSYAYWVTTSVYTPLNASGVLPASGNSSGATLRSARSGSPAPLDVLLSGDQRSVYLSGVLPPVGQSTDYRALALLGVALAALLFTVGLAVYIWRQP